MIPDSMDDFYFNFQHSPFAAQARIRKGRGLEKFPADFAGRKEPAGAAAAASGRHRRRPREAARRPGGGVRSCGKQAVKRPSRGMGFRELARTRTGGCLRAHV